MRILVFILSLSMVSLVAASDSEQCRIISSPDNCFFGVEVRCPSHETTKFLAPKSGVWYRDDLFQIRELCQDGAKTFWTNGEHVKFYNSLDDIY